MTGRPRVAAPPPLFEPFVVLIELVERRLRRIRPIRRGGILGLELGRRRGPAVTLRDGTSVDSGDPIGLIHLDNRAARTISALGYGTAGRIGRADLAALASWARRQAPGRRPVAYYGETLLWPYAVREGFEARDRRQTVGVRVEDLYLRALMAHWSRDGWRRLECGRGELRSREVWASDAAIQRRFGTVTGTLPGPRLRRRGHRLLRTTPDRPADGR